MNSESANQFIAALVKSLQTLCHGYVDFDDGIEIIGHLYLNIDSGSTFDYVLKEKVCKNAENSTVFLSKSFHAEGKPENTLIRTDKDRVLSHDDAEAGALGVGDNGMSPSGTTRLQSAITNISNVLSGNTEHHVTHSPLALNTGRRKRDHNGSYSNQHLPYKYTTLQSSSSSAMPYFSNSSKQHSAGRDNAKHYNSAQGEFFGGDSNQSSGMGGDDEEDLHLDVTFVKEEYGDRHRAGHVSRTHQDPSGQGNMMQENSAASGGGAYPMGYHPGSQQQHFAGSGGSSSGDMGSSLNPAFQDPSQVDTGQHHIPPLPNPRSNINSSNALPPPSTNNNVTDNNQQTFQVPATPTKYFRCNVCGIIIRHKNNIKRHMRRHNDPALSGSSVGGAASISKMWSQHYSNNTTPSTTAAATTTAPTSSSPATAGTTIVHVEKPTRTYSCIICGLQISHRKNVRRHMRKHTGEMFFCDLCDWKGTCRWKMQKHREKKHGIPIMLPVT